MSDSQSLIKAGPNEILQRIKMKNERIDAIEAFAHNLGHICRHVTRHDLLALDDEELKAVVKLLCKDVPKCYSFADELKGAEDKFGYDWIDVDKMRKALAAHTDGQSYAYLVS